MEQTMMMAMQTCQLYSRRDDLTKTEILMYEQMCRTIQMYMLSFENSFRIGIHEQEKEFDGRLKNDSEDSAREPSL